MLTREENELLTRTGPGTAAGRLLRRYWQPVALLEELPVGGAPLPVKLLGEELVLFRDDDGHPGLLGIHCAHRGADLSYGRIEDGGLRCLYHGWLYDVGGRCLEQPGEPVGSSFHQRIRQTAYPCAELGGMIMAYLGGGQPPLLPRFEFLEAPDERRVNTKELRECNYLQGNEGNFDPQHLGVLHWVATGAFSPQVDYYRRAPRPALEVEDTEFGVRIYTILPVDAEKNYVSIHNFVMPNLSAFGSGGGQNGYGVNWHVPIDDTTHWVYRVQFNRVAAIDHEAIKRARAINPDYRRTRTRANRYLQDREEMKERTFAGVGYGFPDQDAVVTEGAGLIQDRTQEHLGYNDQGIVAQRQMLLRAIREVEAGREAPLLTRDPGQNPVPSIVAWSRELPVDTDYRAYCRETEQAVAV